MSSVKLQYHFMINENIFVNCVWTQLYNYFKFNLSSLTVLNLFYSLSLFEITHLVVYMYCTCIYVYNVFIYCDLWSNMFFEIIYKTFEWSIWVKHLNNDYYQNFINTFSGTSGIFFTNNNDNVFLNRL